MRSATRDAGRAAVVLSLAAVALLVLASCRDRPHRDPFHARDGGVSDGDTITVLDGTTPVIARLILLGLSIRRIAKALGVDDRTVAKALARSASRP